jgi:hypothetical protein
LYINNITRKFDKFAHLKQPTMASYTDSPQTFNPYVAQKPVDAMLKVGMYKQQKYEEGYQRYKAEKELKE